MPSKVPALADLLGESPAITSLREKIGRLLQRQPDGRRPPPILIQGETGTGKGFPGFAQDFGGDPLSALRQSSWDSTADQI